MPFPHDQPQPSPGYARQKIRVLDLFAGAGGLTEGLHEASHLFETVAAVEMNPEAAATFQVNNPAAEVHCERIEEWLEKSAVPSVDLVVGGPPCQGFSQLGKRALDDERNSMWRHYAAAVAKARPRYFVMENVPQFLLSPEFKLFRDLVDDEDALGEYDFQAEVLNAADFGAPQKRKRAIVIGFRTELGDPGFPTPTHGPGTAEPYVTVRDTIHGLPRPRALPNGKTHLFGGRLFAGPYRVDELHVDRNYTQLSRARFREIPPGGNRFDLPEELLCDAWRKHKTGSGDVMGRLHWDQPSVTIRTEFTKPEKGRYLHPELHRAITPREGALLQGFPPGYEFVGSLTQVVRQIGNAVPVPLGEAIGRHLLPLLTAP